MYIVSLIFLLLSFSVFAQEDLQLSEEVDYTGFAQELTFLEEAAKEATNKEEQKLLNNVDKISVEKVETPAHTYADEHTDLVSTSTAAVEKTAPEFRPSIEKKRRVRSR